LSFEINMSFDVRGRRPGVVASVNFPVLSGAKMAGFWSSSQEDQA
jgi:hypothetical protein